MWGDAQRIKGAYQAFTILKKGREVKSREKKGNKTRRAKIDETRSTYMSAEREMEERSSIREKNHEKKLQRNPKSNITGEKRLGIKESKEKEKRPPWHLATMLHPSDLC